jgi:hypothetical protein
MKDLAMWVFELGGYWRWLSSSRSFIKKIELDPIQKRKPFTF